MDELDGHPIVQHVEVVERCPASRSVRDKAPIDAVVRWVDRRKRDREVAHGVKTRTGRVNCSAY
jgi:hypothetical protein